MAEDSERSAPDGGGLAPTRPLDRNGGRSSPPDDPARISAGDRIERYVIGKRLGAGGMGSVYHATDEVLHRPVALKLLHSDAMDRAPALARQVVEEARIAATLSHPNVVSVYEVSTCRHGPFIAMEYVEGTTLGEWIDSQPRTWREVVAILREAGRGLAAAHDAGVIHRDIKPSNILVAPDRVVVADFGIARRVDDSEDGAVGAGTPIYLPPEQAAGERCDERSDVYAFCVAAFQCLYGRLPERTEDGAVAEPAANPRGVPGWLNRVIVRGLALDPADRYPKLAPLLAALSRDPGRTRRRVVLGAFGAAAFAVAGAIAVTALRQPTEAAVPCDGMERYFAGIWDAGVRSEIEAAFEATGRPYWQSMARSVASSLDSFRTEWTARRVAACQATHVHRDQSPELMDAKMRCLDRHLMRVAAVVGRFRTADGRTLDRAPDALVQSTSIECDDPATLNAAFPPPDDPQTSEQIEKLRERLAEVEALLLTAGIDQALLEIDQLEAPVATIDYLPLEADWLWHRGLVQNAHNQFGPATETFRTLTRVASRAGNDRLVARTWMTLMFSLGWSESWRKALELGDVAEAAIARAGEPLDLQAQLANQLGLVHGKLGNADEERGQLERSVRLGERALGPDSLRLASPLNNLGAAYMRAGDFEAAGRVLRRALDIREREYGGDHPAVGGIRTNLALVEMRQGRYDEAAVLLEQILELNRATLPPTHRLLGHAHLNIASNELNRKDHDAARRHVDRAMEIYAATFPATSPEIAKARQLSGVISIAAGNASAGLASCSQARSALTAGGIRSEHLVAAMVCIGEARLKLGQPAQALDQLREGRALEDELGVTAQVASHTRSMVSLALWDLGKRADALREARIALETMRGPKAAELSERIEAWSSQIR